MKIAWANRGEPQFAAQYDAIKSAWTEITNIEFRTELNMERTAANEA